MAFPRDEWEELGYEQQGLESHADLWVFARGVPLADFETDEPLPEHLWRASNQSEAA